MTKGHEPPGWVNPVRWAAIALLILGPAATGGAWFLGLDPEVALGLAGTALGISVSAGGAALAALIYQRQYEHAEASGEDTNARIDRANDKIDLLASEVGRSLSEAEAEAAADKVVVDPAEEDAVARGNDVWVGDQAGRELAPHDVPLSVLGNLVWGWRRDEANKNNDGRWTVQNLQGAWRPASKAADGRGNTPWYLTFRNSGGERRVWRVYRGGKRKPEPTVRDVTDEVS
ncbi:hypothetical protein [Calidifontibacter indicus]|uniref:hypothetical protein n=1 Tax=Calidifontibacter indicus TaxID=419650 RepID=UPI003D7114C7